ncbi:alpha/beta hydrolase [Ketobacter nezhaii]|uniref:alpha/beta hydrolase n=1 Tax=Ketobacter sp. MCCC 1A13808 TaxID=2602738 RepID=UPI0018DE0230|nr:alpha/beta fold hydrolase [Ketobacter sp. MCCC 1A13808]
MVRTPADIGLSYQDVELNARDQTKLHGWLLKTESLSPKGMVFFLHGNAENISTHIASVYWLPQYGYDVFMLDYRGYGQSQGKPDLPQVFMDVEAGYRWVSDYAQERNLDLFVLGQSLGAAISSYYFAEKNTTPERVKGVILDAVFSGHRDIAKAMLSRHWLTWPAQFAVAPLLPTQYNPADHVAQISPTPLLILHSPEDQVIPFTQGQTVYQQAQQPKYWVSTKGPHITTFNFPAYQQLLLRFLAEPGVDPQTSPTDHRQTDSTSSPLQTSTSAHAPE